MIPSFGLGDVLPPYVGSDVTGELQLPRSPYPATVLELVDTFCTSSERAEILRGFIAYRGALRGIGFTSGLQWVDGSFVENCERVRGRAPSDIDVVSLLRRPANVIQDVLWEAFVQAHGPTLFNSGWTKNNHRCDAYYIDLDADPTVMALTTAYWIGLFSHQRTSMRWKGLVQVELDDHTEGQALALIDAREATW